MQPIIVPSNRPPERFYLGGRRITDFRGEPPAGDREPEDWVGSTTALFQGRGSAEAPARVSRDAKFGQDPVGLTVLPDGQTLASMIERDPDTWLGPDHVDAFGADTKLLVKLLDAGQRLPVHAHPHLSFASEHLGCAHGKAEAWFILQGGTVHLGLVEDVTPQRLGQLVAGQDVEALLGLLHQVQVAPGDVVYVPPGVLHAIGQGVFLVELQEPEDLSILLEWRDFALDGARDGHLGLGFDTALQAVEGRARSAGEMADLVRPAGFGASVLPPAADSYFRLERRAVDGPVTIAPGFAILVVTNGDVSPDDGGLHLPRGTTAIVPHAAGPVELGGRGEALVCRPPSP